MSWESFKLTLFVRAFTFLKIPLLWWVRPTIVEMSDKKIELKIPLSRRTKNHLNSMYFGALCMGGEAAVAVKGVKAIHDSKQKIDFIFKDFQANFLKRAGGDVHFICEEGFKVDELVEKAKHTSERLEVTVKSYAIVPKINPQEKVAEFAVTMSLKKRNS